MGLAPDWAVYNFGPYQAIPGINYDPVILDFSTNQTIHSPNLGSVRAVNGPGNVQAIPSTGSIQEVWISTPIPASTGHS